MTNPYRDQLRRVVEHTGFSSGTYVWFDQLGTRLPPRVRALVPSELKRSHLLHALQQRLYTHFYCTGGAVAFRADPGATPTGSPEFVDRLSHANSVPTISDPGWTIVASERDGLVVQGGAAGLTLWVDTQRGVGDGRGSEGGGSLGAVDPDGGVVLQLPAGLRGLFPGFYTVSVGMSSQTDDPLIRIYWNLTPDGAVVFVEATTTCLPDADLPFTLKVVNDPARYDRRDVVVLYLRRSDLDAATGCLGRLYSVVRGHLRHGRPAMTGSVESGVGIAEDPGGGASFGWHRCGLVAEGLVRAEEARLRGSDERLRSIGRCFAEADVELDKPYVRAGSPFERELRLDRPTRGSNAPRRPVDLSSRDRPEAGDLDIAQAIGRRLARRALWWGGRCTWLGPEPARIDADPHAPPTWTSLGADLYDGTSGIALFLGELSSATDDPVLSRTALGAIRHALDSADRSSLAIHPGAYSGWAGLAFAAARLGHLLGEAGLLDRAAGLVAARSQPVRAADGDRVSHDLVSGRAGAILALLALGRLLGDGRIDDIAIEHGQRLLDAACSCGDGISWPTRTTHLTGYAHGASGPVHAFVELADRTRDRTFAHAAERAMAFERGLLDPVAGNWPDRRRRRGVITDRPRFMTTWCHGAPGIALARLRAWEVLGSDLARQEALLAVGTTFAATRRLLEMGDAENSLCHGLAGNTEVCLSARGTLGDDMADPAELVAAVRERSLVAQLTPAAREPVVDRSPGLMLGEAGIGYYHLRRHDVTVPSLVLLRPEDHAV